VTMFNSFEPMGLRIYLTFATPLVIMLGMVWYEQLKHALRLKQHFGRCYHVEQCLKCLAVYAYDSSD